MQLLISKNPTPEEWNASLKALNGCAFHTYEWSHYSATNNGLSRRYFQLTDDSGHSAAMVHGLVHTLFQQSSFFGTLAFGSFPAYRDVDSLHEMITAIRTYALKQGMMALVWNSFGTPDACHILENRLSDPEKRWEFLVNLNGSKDELWERLHGKKRNLIRKAMKTDVEIKCATQMAELIHYRSLVDETWRRKIRSGISYPEPPTENTMAILKRTVIDTGLGKMLLAYSGSQPVAGAFFVADHRSAYYVLSAANELGLRLSAPDLLLWEAMTHYQRSGLKLFNLGGLSESELGGDPLEKSGLYHFKKRFSADVRPCYVVREILRPFQYGIRGHIKNFKKNIKFILKKASHRSPD